MQTIRIVHWQQQYKQIKKRECTSRINRQYSYNDYEQRVSAGVAHLQVAISRWLDFGKLNTHSLLKPQHLLRLPILCTQAYSQITSDRKKNRFLWRSLIHICYDIKEGLKVKFPHSVTALGWNWSQSLGSRTAYTCYSIHTHTVTINSTWRCWLCDRKDILRVLCLASTVPKGSNSPWSNRVVVQNQILSFI